MDRGVMASGKMPEEKKGVCVTLMLAHFSSVRIIQDDALHLVLRETQGDGTTHKIDNLKPAENRRGAVAVLCGAD